MRLWKYIFVLLLLVLALEVIAVYQLPDSKFHIVACDVGEGDATLLIYRNIQILVDGGPNSKVLTCLGRHLPFWDRRIELVILTHPDRDHFLGLIDVFKNYKIDSYLYNPITVSKPEYKVLEREVGRGGVARYNPINGQRLRLGLIYLDTLSPLAQLPFINRQFSNEKEVPDNETNQYSIVSLVSFGKFRAILTGDMTPSVSDGLAAARPDISVNYIKVPHHGSKNGLTQNLLEILRPQIATISVGKNLYGHPAPEIVEMLNEKGVKTLRTDEEGDIEVVSDGEKFWTKN